jgi:hypothetical protein
MIGQQIGQRITDPQVVAWVLFQPGVLHELRQRANGLLPQRPDALGEVISDSVQRGVLGLKEAMQVTVVQTLRSSS